MTVSNARKDAHNIMIIRRLQLCEAASAFRHRSATAAAHAVMKSALDVYEACIEYDRVVLEEALKV